MPYTDGNDAKLPDEIKKLPIGRRNFWVGLFNGAHKRCQAGTLAKPATGEDGKKDCESRAFAFASGVLKKTKELDGPMSDEQTGVVVDAALAAQPPVDGEEAEKDHPAEAVEPCAPVYRSPYEGLTSFAEVDQYREGQRERGLREDSMSTFRRLFDNIWDDDDSTVEQKVAATRKLEGELLQRVAEPQRFALKAVPDAAGALVRSVGSFLLGRAHAAKPDDAAELPHGSEKAGFFVLGTKEGGLRYLTIASNKFRDRSGEVFPEAVHEEYVEYADRTKDYPELRLWHVPGSRIGQADFVAVADGFCISSGRFDPGMEEVGRSLAGAKGLAVSQGYRYGKTDLDKATGEYRQYRRFEESVLPISRAANQWTAVSVEEVAKEVEMALPDAKRAFLVEHLGEERTKGIETALASATAELEKAGIGWKEVLDIGEKADPASQEPAATGTPPADAPKGDEPKAAADGSPAAAASPPAAGAPAAPDPAPQLKPEPQPVAQLDPQIAEAICAAVQGAVAPLAEAVAGMQSEVKELQVSTDEKVAAGMGPSRDPAPSAGQRPTESTKNVIDGEKADELAAVVAASASDNGDQSPAAKAARPYAEAFLLGKPQD